MSGWDDMVDYAKQYINLALDYKEVCLIRQWLSNGVTF